MTDKQLLLAFFISYRDWIRNGALDNEPYRRHYGLCSNFRDYLDSINRRDKGWVLGDLLHKHFPYQDTPFNRVRTLPTYYIEAEDCMCHINPLRRAWVDKQILALQEEEPNENILNN